MKSRKLLALVLSFLLLTGLLGGCAAPGPQDTTPAATEDPAQTTATDLATQATQETTQPIAGDETTPTTETTEVYVPLDTEPPVQEQPDPVEIVTSGGVVLIGTVQRDEDGWYLAPEQPLDLELSFFLEPSVFEGLTKVRLFDARDDGIDKSLYAGQLVTIEGSLCFYRDYLDRVYLQIYTITYGRNAAQSYAAPELMPPEKEEVLYDPSLPLPKYMLPMINEGKYVYNAFMLSTETLKFMGNDFASFYISFVDAILNYQSTCPCPNENYAEMLSTIITYELPLYGAVAEPFEFYKHYDRDTQTVTIPYLYDEQAHQQKLSQFLAAADELLATTSEDQSPRELAQNIYHEICIRMTYDDSALTVLSRKASHYAYLEHSGVCITFANIYNQLLTQVGIEATVACCDYDGTMGHAWSMITIDGQNYFCDPTFELNFIDGTAYRYFGMNYSERIKSVTDTNGIYAGKYYTNLVTADDLAENHIPF